MISKAIFVLAIALDGSAQLTGVGAVDDRLYYRRYSGGIPRDQAPGSIRAALPQAQAYQPQTAQSQAYQPQTAQPQTYQPQKPKFQEHQPYITQAYQPQTSQSQAYQPQKPKFQEYQHYISQSYQPQTSQSQAYQPQKPKFQEHQPYVTQAYQPQTAQSQAYDYQDLEYDYDLHGNPNSLGGYEASPFAYSSNQVSAPAHFAPIDDQYQVADDYGQYVFGFSSGDAARSESRDAYGNVRGSYDYIDSDGKLQTQHYVADENGFRVIGSNIPEGPKAQHYAPEAALPSPVQDTPEVSAAKAAFAKAYNEAAVAAAEAPDTK